MKSRGKSSNTPYPIWIYGEYITIPPKRPDGTMRQGHYIDKGGYPGANVYAVDMATFCRQTAAVDRHGKEIYTQDILLYETEEEIGYFIIENEETAADVVWGEIVALESLCAEDIKVIGNLIDNPDFIDGIRNYVEYGIEIPYLPLLDVNLSAFPYLRLECIKCKKIILSCKYAARCSRCGGILIGDFATKVYREKEKAFA